MAGMEDDVDEMAMMRQEAEDFFCVSSRIPEIMAAAGTHSPGGPNGIIRSQSFAGFSTLQEKRSRCNSFMGNSVPQKKPASKPKKPHLSSHKGGAGAASREPQPGRLEDVYTALKRGLEEYLEVHQTELDKLTLLMKDMKRNSRLGVLYDLDKQIKAIERYMRRLEFHMSKVDELYEAFCIQSRLRDGASRMKQAFTSSPSTKATKESIAEVNRRYKEYTENMSAFESDLENLLGEFHIKMKGLAGFARLCPGDQYEIFMRYGRQRWKLKGRIEVNSRQSWDGDEMVFMPLISDLINIKVTELKGLTTHLLVGSVICETKELFTAMPQVVAVDINDLGTIKLNLEVTWYPFDVEDLTLSSSNISKAAAIQRRVSIYSQGTPETPTFQDASFFSTLPDDVFENGSVSECKRLSYAFSDASSPSPAPSSHSPAPSNPEITVTPPDTDASASPCRIREGSIAEEEEEEEEEDCGAGETDSGTSGSLEDSEWERTESQRSSGRAATVAPEDVFLDHVDQLKPVQLEQDDEDDGGNLTRQLVKRLTSSEVEDVEEGRGIFLEGGGLEDAIHGLLLTLEALTHRCRELQDLEQEVMRLEDLLKCRLPGHRSRSSSLSLTVESALESFDFLNTSDFDDDDTGDDAAAAAVVILAAPPPFDNDGERSGGQHPEARGHLSEALTEDTGVGNSVAGSPLPLTTGNDNLDAALVVHLRYCRRLIQVLSGSVSACRRRGVLLKMVEQTRLLEEIAEMIADHPGVPTSPAEVMPGLAQSDGFMSWWAECSGSTGNFHTTLDRVLGHMTQRYQEMLTEKYPQSCHAVISLVACEMADQNNLPEWNGLRQDVVTVFQFHTYILRHQVRDMETHLLQLASEESFVERLRSGDAQQCLSALEEVPACHLWPQGATLRTLASLLTADDPAVKSAASDYLAAAPNAYFRNKAVECYTEALSEAGVHSQRAACAALSCLRAVESIRAVVALCDSADEELRHVAIETLLTFGEDGRLAYEQLDTVPGEMIRLGGRRGNAVTTAF
ncbi:rho family-interacting cell polarization regulator 2 isoform X2 [Corythoichthys intestinalis]|uniref:rho family-interacting cell polarization regulator 2 isoform X2 n=1 Tax=Corythoichthys intestinalis TaxID=161448 RepID=UPI0025A54C09|nr:rho family-interacting cell polarization regulator 2 isoform X2 [Corythoichthys intestinalis]